MSMQPDSLLGSTTDIAIPNASQYRLVDVRRTPPGLERLRHSLAGRSRVRFVGRVLEVGVEISKATVLDWVSPLSSRIQRVERGDLVPTHQNFALYLHWSPTGAISDMVFEQIESLQGAGFSVVFISNASPPALDWERIGAATVLRIERANVGRDFGGWRDALALAMPYFGKPAELLLVNDSVLGPVRSLGPVLEALRSGGDGLFGLTESRGGGAHLQSYFVMARGEAAVDEMIGHLGDCRPSRSKWRLVQQGEIGLTTRFLRNGHRVAALFDWERVAASLTPADLAGFGPLFQEFGALDRYPLNPTHHLWRILVERFAFPFIKTELVLRNPGRLPDVHRWPELVDERTRRSLEQHLDLMARRVD